ncbi:MAG: hypothetical protein A2Y79_07845 [Deltaproteobacteria bacterium RBG_13_43_22]|nr:MAG: hypothetical protein A2Y79_07845 [Deltaproteobacteria bacterium RBG_13_43_22]
MVLNGSTYYLMYDQIGSLRTVTDASGTIVKKIDLDSFGNILSDSNPSFTIPFGFAGGLHDRNTNIVRFGARDYDPSIGKWTAKDPIDFLGGDTNLYGYVLNDPVNLFDSLGLLWFKPKDAPDLFGRKKSWLEPGSPASLFFEKYIPAMYETAYFHDWLVDTLINWGVPDLLANYPTMAFAFEVAFITNFLGPGLTSKPNPNICK